MAGSQTVLGNVLPGHCRTDTTARYTAVSPATIGRTASLLDLLLHDAREPQATQLSPVRLTRRTQGSLKLHKINGLPMSHHPIEVRSSHLSPGCAWTVNMVISIENRRLS
jgi:hypothetical protein